MTGDCHVRICERLGVRLPGATRLWRMQGPELAALHPLVGLQGVDSGRGEIPRSPDSRPPIFAGALFW